MWQQINECSILPTVPICESYWVVDKTFQKCTITFAAFKVQLKYPMPLTYFKSRVSGCAFLNQNISLYAEHESVEMFLCKSDDTAVCCKQRDILIILIAWIKELLFFSVSIQHLLPN